MYFNYFETLLQKVTYQGKLKKYTLRTKINYGDVSGLFAYSLSEKPMTTNKVIQQTNLRYQTNGTLYSSG